MVEAGPQAPPPPGTPSRHGKSLELLTTKFVSLLQEAKDGVLDLELAADTLAVRRKWRIYDITNVLEGIRLMEKKSKHSIQCHPGPVGHQPGGAHPRGPQWAEEVPYSPEECKWPHRGAAVELGGMELTTCGGAYATTRRSAPEPTCCLSTSASAQACSGPAPGCLMPKQSPGDHPEPCSRQH
uniref:E2F/DP family winged-helix DNA-binding domain-containing protein n=1 Tax=Monodon monoceros TaxID=40151 RepID=A0A8C6CHH3_MONMO